MVIAWRAAWRDPSFRVALLAALALAVPIAIGLPVFFGHIGAKPGWRPPDPIIAAIGPRDVTWMTFMVIYAAIVLTVIRALPTPHLLVRGLHAYVLVQFLRMLSLETVTLEPPADIIPLIDPVTVIFYPGGVPFLKDLFFSGHTATLVVLVFISRGRLMRGAMIAATVVVGAFVVIQHVHWTIDVIAAPFFVWLAWRGSALTLRLCGVEAA